MMARRRQRTARAPFPVARHLDGRQSEPVAQAENRVRIVEGRRAPGRRR